MKDFLDKKYVLNPIYKIISDVKRALITNVVEDSLTPRITHPIFGAFLSYFTGNDTCDATLGKICEKFNISKEKALSIVEKFIDNPKDSVIKYDGFSFRFPPQLLIENTDGTNRDDMDPDSMLLPPPYDFTNIRLYKPSDVLFVINTKCVTDCIYCYADKKKRYTPMPTEKVLDIIDQAKALGVRKFELSGGEVLLHKDWQIIVKKLVDCGYSDLISTKIPLTKQQIDDYVATGMDTLQISLDSLNPEIQAANLKVDADYCEKMKESLRYLDTKGIGIIIKGTFTRHTFTIENINEILEFISTLKNLTKFTVSTIGASMFKTNESFHDLKPSSESVKKIYDYLDSLKTDLYIQKDSNEANRDEMCNFSKFKNRTLCTGNVSGLIILPDGKVTICEELYWDENFILGDLMENTLAEVWNSEKALDLWNIKQSIFPKESACSTCQDFVRCRKGLGVCWKYVIAVYGRKNYLFPDPRCPKAPAMIYDVFYD